MDSRTARALPVLLGLGCVWGGSFLFIKVIVEDTGPMELVFGRLFFGLLAVCAYILISRRRISITPRLAVQMAGVAVLSNVLPFGLIAWAEEHIPSGTASILNATVPIFTSVVAAAALDDERFTAGRMFGLVLGFCGVAVLTGDDVLRITDSDVLGQLAVVAASLCYGITAVISRNLLRGNDPVSMSVMQLSMGALFALPAAFVISGGSPDFSIEPEAWGSLVALGMLGTGLGYIAWLWLIENIGSVRASLVTYVVPVVAVVLGWLVLDESIGLNTIGGGVLIVAGVASVMRGAAPVRKSAVTVAAPTAVGE